MARGEGVADRDHVDVRAIRAVRFGIAKTECVHPHPTALVGVQEVVLDLRLRFEELDGRTVIGPNGLPRLALVRKKSALGDVEADITVETFQQRLRYGAGREAKSHFDTEASESRDDPEGSEPRPPSPQPSKHARIYCIPRPSESEATLAVKARDDQSGRSCRACDSESRAQRTPRRSLAVSGAV